MTRALVKSSRYSPGNLTPEALERLSVGREKLLDDVLRRIAASATGGGKHFILLVGQRGVGKTHFLELVHHRLMTGEKWAPARARLKIAFLNEEEWGVASFLDFLVRILKALATRDPSLAPQIEEIYTRHARSTGEALDAAESLLVKHVGSDCLLVLCENLVDLFAGLGDEGQKRWRALIQEKPLWTILATTPALFSGVRLRSSPFYGFFTVRQLDRLDSAGALQLLRRLAEIQGKADLAAALETPLGRARVRAIHHLAGGYHRVYVVMADFLTGESLDDLLGPFFGMIDDLTPYYQDRVRLLAPRQRKIVEFLAQQKRPVVVKEVAVRCLMSQQTAAKQVGELARSGFVAKTRVGRDTYCELAEPLMRICFEVKDKRTGHIELFVDFLRRWFSTEEMRSRLEALREEPYEAHPADRCHLEAALARCDADEDQPLLRALAEEARASNDAGYYAQAAAVVERLLERTRAPAERKAHWWALRTVLELGRARYRDALEAARTACKLAADPWFDAASHAAAAVAAVGFGAGLEVLRSAPAAFRAGVTVAEVAARMLVTEAELRGPIALGRAIEELLPALEERSQGDAVADMLTALLRELLAHPELDAASWSAALPRIAAAADHLPECSTPLAMLSAGIRFRESGDRAVLLELPLEQRAIVQGALGAHASPAR